MVPSILLSPTVLDQVLWEMQCLMNFDVTKVAQVVGAVTKALSVDDKKEAILVSGQLAMSCS